MCIQTKAEICRFGHLYIFVLFHGCTAKVINSFAIKIYIVVHTQSIPMTHLPLHFKAGNRACFLAKTPFYM